MKLEDYLNKHGNIEVDEKELNKVLGIKEKPSKIFRPVENEKYWFIDSRGDCYPTIWNDCNCNTESFKIRNCFKTAKEAKDYVEKLKIHRELELYADEHNDKANEWNEWKQQSKWFICYDCVNLEFNVSQKWSVKFPNTVYFTSEEIALGAIQAIGEDRLKKYYFDVKE